MTPRSNAGWTRWLRQALAAALAFAVLTASAADRVMLHPNSGTPLAAQPNPETREKVRKLRENATRRGAVRVIVALATPFAAEGTLPAPAAAQQRKEIGDKQQAVLRRLPAVAARADQNRIYKAVPFMALAVTPDELDALLQDPDIAGIQEDTPERLQLAFSVPQVFAGNPWNAGFAGGAGQAVAILDTGIDGTHPMLAGKVIAEGCFNTNSVFLDTRSTCPGGVTRRFDPGSGRPCEGMAECRHGTFVAGIATGHSGLSATAIGGVAKDAKLIAINVFSKTSTDCGTGITSCTTTFPSDQIAALEYVLDLQHQHEIAAVNMSLGGGRFTGTCDAFESARKAAIDNLRSANIATIISSGNTSHADAMSSPACISTAISVGSTHARSDVFDVCPTWSQAVPSLGSVSCFSNASSVLSLLAPGSGITSAAVGGGYGSSTGTSFAAPHVAGAWAVMKQRRPSGTVPEILGVLQATGVPTRDHRNNLVKPRIDLQRALDTVAAATHHLLSIDIQGGPATVTSSPTGIFCSAACSAPFAEGTSVTLTASVAAGFAFGGWQGACNGMGACTVTMAQAQGVTALVTAPPFNLTTARTGTGSGTVSRSSGALQCGATCTESLAAGTVVLLTATPDAASVFSGWSGTLCSGAGNCSFSMPTAHTQVVAAFSPAASANPVTALDLAGLTASASGSLRFSVVPPAGATDLVITVSTATGDADLYIARDRLATATVFDCRSTLPAGNADSCTFASPAPGTYHILVSAFSSFTGGALRVTWRPAPTPPPAGGSDLMNVINLLLLN